MRFDPEHSWSAMMEIVMLVFQMKGGSLSHYIFMTGV